MISKIQIPRYKQAPVIKSQTLNFKIQNSQPQAGPPTCPPGAQRGRKNLKLKLISDFLYKLYELYKLSPRLAIS